MQSLIVARARLEPPAARATGTVRVRDAQPGTIRLATLGNVLVFSDSYDERWTATQDGLPLVHVVANGYANGWLVPNPSAGDVILSFWPQRSFALGIRISLALALLALIAIVVLVRRAQ